MYWVAQQLDLMDSRAGLVSYLIWSVVTYILLKIHMVHICCIYIYIHTHIYCWLKTQHSKNENHGIQSHHFMANRWGNNGNSDRFYFLGLRSKIIADGDCSHEIKRCLLLVRKAVANPGSILKSRDIILPTKVHIVKAVFSSNRVQMWELDHKEV